MADNCRAAAARVLGKVLGSHAAMDGPLACELRRVSARDKALLQQLCYGTLRDYYRLDWMLTQLLKKPLKARDADLQALLLCGIYQLLDLRTPDHAAIGETVEACRVLGKAWATGLVNGVLRNCRRNARALQQDVPSEVALNHPGWLLDTLRSAWPDHWQSIVDADNAHPPMCLRVNQRQSTRQDYLEALRDAGIEGSACTLAADGIRLAVPRDVATLPGFADGRCSVQDEAAQLAAPLLAPAPGDRILDACSAPGGKTCHLLEIEPAIELVAMDSDEERLVRVRENLTRLDLTAAICVGDGRSPPEGLEPGSFDRILVDAPCSGTGVVRRHPDIKLLRRPADIPAYHRQQLDILCGLWPLLRPGGCLLYVTCSILPAENSEVVSEFLDGHPDAVTVPLDVTWGLPAGPGRQVLPTTGGPDGLYFALLERHDTAAPK